MRKHLSDQQQFCLNAIKQIETNRWFGKFTAKNLAFLRCVIRECSEINMSELAYWVGCLLVEYDVAVEGCKVCPKVFDDNCSAISAEDYDKSTDTFQQEQQVYKKKRAIEFNALFGDVFPRHPPNR